MPRRTDLKSVLVIGSGPIVIGQAAEFDYSGTQALRVLKEEGLRVILVNSNPATIMTDPEFADATYVEPITPEVVEKIIAKERPDAILPTLGGQTALNTAIALDKSGALEKYNVELIGANIAAIELGEDREKFKGVVERCGAESAKSIIVHSMDEAFAAAEKLGYPMVVRPSFTMGGLGSGLAYNAEDLRRIAGAGIQYSPTSEVLLEESILGWKEYELEMMRDKNDNVVVVCSIENFDPVGVHTGDSITVAPAMTLTDREYQKLRNIAVTQFVDQYCLGPYYQFMHDTVVTNETGKVTGYQNLNEVGKRLSAVLIRRRKRDVALQLPERQDKILFVPMTKEQREMHDEYQHQVSMLVYKWIRYRFLSEKDRKRLLLFLSQMRMVCDSTYILDQKSRFDTKIEETMNILSSVFESGDEKVVIFSQWERMARLVAAELDKMGIQYEYLHGGVPSEKRKDLMENFTTNPESRVFLSTDAGSTGLNLQAASILINLDLPWNPAVLEQRIARIYRLGQQHNIQVINMVASQTIEERMLSTLNFKSSLFEGILDNGADSILLEDSKLDKIMDSIKEVVEPTEEENNTASDISTEDVEEVVKPSEEPIANPHVETALQEPTLPFEEDVPTEKETTTTPPHEPSNPQELLQQGFSFFSGLAKTLQSPEATKQLVDSIVKVDEKTGETSLHIPIPNKESVTNVLGMLGKLFG